MPKFLASCHYNEEEINRHLRKNRECWPVQMNDNKFATGQILKKPVEVVKEWILASWAQKSPEPCPGRVLGIVSQNPHVSMLLVVFRCFGVFCIDLWHVPNIRLKGLVIFMQSWTSAGYFSNSTCSSITSGRFSYKGMLRCTNTLRGHLMCTPTPLYINMGGNGESSHAK